MTKTTVFGGKTILQCTLHVISIIIFDFLVFVAELYRFVLVNIGVMLTHRGIYWKLAGYQMRCIHVCSLNLIRSALERWNTHSYIKTGSRDFEGKCKVVTKTSLAQNGSSCLYMQKKNLKYMIKSSNDDIYRFP